MSSSGTTGTGSSTLDQLIDEAIFQALHTSARTLTWYCALGLGIEGIILGAILSQTYRYYEHFKLQDSRSTLFLVGLGTSACLGQFGLNLWQTYMFIDKAATQVFIVLEKDVYADMTVLLFIGIFNLGAAVYFSRRAIKLVGKKHILIPILGSLALASFAMCLACVITGFRVPGGTGDLKGWITNVNKWVIAWTAVSVVTDLCVCFTMTYALINSRDEIKAAATSLMRKLLMLTFETMLPPVTVTFLLLIFGTIENATMGNFSRVLVWTIGPLYFHAIIHSLVGRHDIQFILQQQQGGSNLPTHHQYNHHHHHHHEHEHGYEHEHTRYASPVGINIQAQNRIGEGNGDVQLMPVVMDTRAKKELGWEDNNEFGINSK
ncbi:uncharacterized protein IL334_001517 [Kwoniella shivajii]|uniref:DUF6534 domain-containing protein n=1 Tax=Kwoniella shivajii TaxID=564305 RepID=A0ABZ1CS71_9TREE|nr:hypothetical protein IL334_001517 [Kwoniella shivajii]